MTFKFLCSCGQKVSATDDMIGTTAICPQCGARVTVKRPPPEKADAPLPAPVSVELGTAPSPAVPATPPPVAEPPPVAPQPTPAPPTPIRVVPRPTGLLWGMALLAVFVLFGGGIYLFREKLHPLPEHFLGILLGAAVSVGAVAVLLRLAVRVVLRFDFAFSEALAVTLFTMALDSLALTPGLLARYGQIPPELAARLLPITCAASIFLTILIYSFLIRNALGRTIGAGRALLVYLLQLFGVALAVGLIAVATGKFRFPA